MSSPFLRGALMALWLVGILFGGAGTAHLMFLGRFLEAAVVMLLAILWVILLAVIADFAGVDRRK